MGEFWQSPDAHGGGGYEIFAHDLSVLKWNRSLRRYDRIESTSDSNLEDYLVWEKPVYAMADGEVMNWEDSVPDDTTPNPPNLPPSSLHGDHPWGNYFLIRHGTDLVTYCHLREASLNPALMIHPPPRTENVIEGDLLGLVGNSGNTNDHIYISLQ